MPTTPERTSRLGAALRDRAIWQRTALLGLPVGLLQAALNQGDHWWRHSVDALVVVKTLLCPVLSCTIVFLSAAFTRRPSATPTS